MNILQVIHGYPPHYMAGSEVYTYNLSKELSKRSDVTVFCRIEDKEIPRHELSHSIEENVSIYRVNNPFVYDGFKCRYLDKDIDRIFKKILEIINPDIVHIGHLHHLSTSIVKIIKKHKLPIVYTLHDFWLLCPRGQLIKKDLTICKTHELNDCVNCFKKELAKEGVKGIQKREKRMKEMFELVDLFIAPSRFLLNKYIEEGVPKNKMIYSDYGFDTSLFKNFKRKPSDNIRFGYIGTHIPTKGVDILIKAFNKLNDERAVLNIFGARHENTKELEKLVKNKNIFFMGGYNNKSVGRVLSGIDIVVVPSLWYENSPLVIHEAFLAKAPVIASNIGGMAEYVKHMENGLLFEVGNPKDLLTKIELLLNNPALINKFGRVGMPIKSIQEDSMFLEKEYERLLKERDSNG